jgi:hypothetical protein
MSPRTAAEIAFGVLGVYLLAGSIPQAIVSVGVVLREQNPDPVMVWMGAIGTALIAAFGAAIVAWRRSLAQRLAPNSQDQVPEAGTKMTYAAAISVVGVYFIAMGLSALLRELLRSLPRSNYSALLSIDSWAEPIAVSAMGAALFLGSRGIANVWRAARGDHRPESSENPHPVDPDERST